MNKKTMFLIALLICGIMIFLICSKAEKQEYYMWEESTEATNWITKEYLIENGVFTSEEIEGIDVDSLVREYGWTEGIEQNESFKRYFMWFGKDYWLPEYVIDYEYLEEKAKYPKWNQLEKAKNSVVRLGVVENSGNENHSMVFDFEKKVAYYGYLEDVFEERLDPGVCIELSDKQIEKINQLLSDNNFFEWNSLYVDWNVDFSEAPDSNFSWNFYVELENGKIYKIYGSQDAPDTYGEVRDGLEKYFKGAKGYPW